MKKITQILKIKFALMAVGCTFLMLTSEKSPQDDVLTLKQATDKRIYWEKKQDYNHDKLNKQECLK